MLMAHPSLMVLMDRLGSSQVGFRVDSSSWKCGHGVEGVSLLLPHPPHQNVRGGRAQSSDNPLCPIFMEWEKEKRSFCECSGGAFSP